MAVEEYVIKESRILVVDDDPGNADLIARTLQRADYTSVRTVTEPRHAAPIFEELRPDLVLLDLHMPEMDGFDVMGQIVPLIRPSEYLPIVVLTGDPSIEMRRRALAVGAKDFLNKPFDQFELLLRIWNLLETRHLYGALAEERTSLAQRVEERTRELAASQQEVIERLAAAAEFKDRGTGEHARRVADLASRAAQRLGVDARQARLIGTAAVLHDVGKISLPDAVQLKPGPLDAAEWEQVRRHTEVGSALLGGSQSPLLRMAEQIARSHHERWDGGGYPDGLSGSAIPLAARIVAAVDAFDAMTHDRPYRPGRQLGDALDELRSERGRQFDPDVVDALIAVIETEGSGGH